MMIYITNPSAHAPYAHTSGQALIVARKPAKWLEQAIDRLWLDLTCHMRG
jgi:hypothetical protein